MSPELARSERESSLVSELEELRQRLSEAEDTLAAIRSGSVDALLVRDADGEQRVYTLSGAERPYREMFERLREGALTLMPDGTIMYCNSRFASMVGEPLEKLMGRPIAPFVTQEGALGEFLATGGNGHVREEFELKRSGGESMPALLSASPFEMEGHRCICMVVTDLTEQRTHQRLRETERRFRRAVDAAGGMAYEASIGTDRLHGLHGAKQLIGEEPLPSDLRRSWWWDRVPDEDRQRCFDCIRRAIKEGTLNFLMEYRVRHANGEYIAVEDHASIERIAAGGEVRIFGVVLNITERKRHQEHQQLLLGELNHRVKNTLATVQAIAAETRNRAESLDHFYRAYEGRLQALAGAHGLLVQGGWQATSLHSLVLEVCRPLVREPGRCQWSGEDVTLSPAQALSLSMMLYELGTNAVKYGAWSNAGGTVSVDSTVLIESGPKQLRMQWIESGGPEVRPPARSGYGTYMLKGIAAYELDGEAEVEYCRRGLRCTLTFPLRQPREAGHFAMC